MAKSKKFDPVERKQLRKDLNEKYRSQANYVRLNGKTSPVISGEIEKTRRRLKIVDRKSVGSEYDSDNKPIEPVKTRNPRRLKVPWVCSYPTCEIRIPEGQEKIMYKKRHYCSEKCVQKVDGLIPFFV